MHTEMPKVAVVIVNYGTHELATNAARSVIRETQSKIDLSIVIIDNCSPGNDAECIAKAIGDNSWTNVVTLIENASNDGFGAGNNTAFSKLKATQPDFIYLLNPDAKVVGDTVSVLLHAFERASNIGAVGSKICDHNGDLQTSAFRFPSIIGEFVNASKLSILSRFLTNLIVPMPADLSTTKVDWVSGASVMLRYEAIQDTKGFDESFFLYFEEVDLMKRIGQAGWEVWHSSDALVEHIQGVSTKVDAPNGNFDRKPRYWYNSWSKYYVKHFGRIGALVAAVSWIFGGVLNQATSKLRGRVSSQPKEFVRDLFSFVVLPLLGVPHGHE